MPARLAFAVSSVTDSRVILDQAGAERLIGKGDMLLLDGGSSVARRIQGAWVTEDEVRKVASVWKRQAPDVAFDDSVQGSDGDDREGSIGSGGSGGGDDDDDMLFQAMELVVRSQLGSTSMLQRKLRVGSPGGPADGPARATGVVGPSEGSKARAVLMTVDELDELLDQRDRGRRRLPHQITPGLQRVARYATDHGFPRHRRHRHRGGPRHRPPRSTATATPPSWPSTT